MTGKFARFGGAPAAGALLVLAACSAEGAAIRRICRQLDRISRPVPCRLFPLNPNAVYQGKHEFDGQLPTGRRTDCKADRFPRKDDRRCPGIRWQL